MTGPRWNANLHAFERVMHVIPEGAERGIDVGCGEGESSRRLRARVRSVVGLDRHDPSIECARSYDDDIDYVLGDLESVPLRERSFDVVSAVAVLHHLDFEMGLATLASLVRPGGMLLVVGLARSRSFGDYARDAYDAVSIRRHTLTKEVWETPAPKVWPPPLTYAQTRSMSLALLPEARFRRVPYFRYGLTWVRPVG